MGAQYTWRKEQMPLHLLNRPFYRCAGNEWSHRSGISGNSSPCCHKSLRRSALHHSFCQESTLPTTERFRQQLLRISAPAPYRVASRDRRREAHLGDAAVSRAAPRAPQRLSLKGDREYVPRRNAM